MENKRAFTKQFIEPMYKAINKNIRAVEYVKATPSNEEYIIIWYNTGFRRQLCVTADSYQAMVLDTILKA